MSATLQESLIAKYFDNCPVVYVPGRNFPVQCMYIEDVKALVRDSQSNIADYRHSNANHDTMNARSLGGSREECYPPKHLQKFVSKKPVKDTGRRGTYENVRRPENSQQISGIITPDVSDRAGGSRKGHVVPKLDPELIADLVLAILQSGGSGRREGDSLYVARISAASGRTRHQVGELKEDPSLAYSSGVNPAPSDENSCGQAILVFLPGMQSISQVSTALRRRGIVETLGVQVVLLILLLAIMWWCRCMELHLCIVLYLLIRYIL